MPKILLLFAHPRFERSRVNKALIEKVRRKEGVTFHDLYEQYPDFNIDVVMEKSLLENHDIIIWHHPFYWYSCPPLLKQWIDVVLEYKWAYGPEGNALEGKQVMSVITTGGTKQVYCAEGTNNYPVNEFLRPFEQTARLCGMEYLPPFVVMGTHSLPDQDLEDYTEAYATTIDLLLEGIKESHLNKYTFFNQVLQLQNKDIK
ncbi:NAD(P)H-dependent oxidoreductase [Ekhidna sp.]|uniref:glutathione-regulated potassium-efflux system oxidoreductase KefF n=1 Tax=Ekhidna sp. TaxID=2608089 RepID=UPI003C7A65B5